MQTNFEIIQIEPQRTVLNDRNRSTVTIMRDRRPDAVLPWCVQYGGGGRYFKTREECDAYCLGRGFKGWR